MKILYLGLFNNPYASELFAANALERQGHEVVRIKETETDSNKLRRQLKDKDAFLFSRVHIDGVDKLADVIKQFDGISAFWIYDPMYSLNRSPDADAEREKWMDTLGPAVNHAFVTDASREDKYKEAGINYHILRQGVSADELIIGRIDSDFRGYDIGFVGSIYNQNDNYTYRKELLDFLANNFKGLLVKGQNDLYEIRGQKLADFCVTVPVIMGDTRYNPDYYWSNRIYNTLGHGGFFITPNVAGLEEEFTEGEHFIGYNIGDFEVLKETVEDYLYKPEERKRIANNGFNHVWNNYTYNHRVKELTDIILSS